jgi:hypothetical protein
MERSLPDEMGGGSPTIDEVTRAGCAQGRGDWRRSRMRTGEGKYGGRRREKGKGGGRVACRRRWGGGFAGGREATENGGEGRRPGSAGEGKS